MWLPVLILAGTFVYFSVHISVADYFYLMDTPSSVARAIAWEPGNADYHALLAEHNESAGLSPEPELLKAASLSPLSSSFLVRAALRAEVDRNYAKAEQLLDKAVAADRKFAPRWALLNFYFRRGSESGVWPPGFWPTLHGALEMSSPEDTNAVFQLAWEQSQDAPAILARLPPKPAVLKAYLQFLMRTERMEAAGPAALLLAHVADSGETPLLLDYCEQAIPLNSGSAVAVWNLLASRKFIPLAPLNATGGTILTNKDFSVTPSGRAFDWKIPAADGTIVSQSDDSHGMNIHFDGSEPEDCVILKQTMPAIPGFQYRIRYEYSSFGRPLKGIYWEATFAGRTLARSPELTAENDNAPGQITFAAEGDSVTLELHYRRPQGSIRAEGSLLIHHLTDQVVK
jgi:hypothetical protein